MPNTKRNGTRGAQEIIDLFASTQPAPPPLEDPNVFDPIAPTPDEDTVVATPPTPDPTPMRPKPERELTPDQRRIRDLEDRLAKEMGGKDPDQELESPLPDGENILIHFLEDGFTALGRVWFRGQELEFTAGSGAYADTCDRYGRSWLELADREFDQVEKYGRVMFRRGPWPGKSYVDAAKVPFEKLRPLKGDGTITGPGPQELEAAARAEQRRGRAAPRLPVG